LKETIRWRRPMQIHSHRPYLDSQAGGGRMRKRLFCLPP
jgi:hypothetical protein